MNKFKIKPSQMILDFIKSFEELRLEAYICPAGKLTIGYGHTSGVKSGMKITREEAEDLLKRDVSFAEKAVDDIQQYFSYQCFTQNEYDALLSLVFNIGNEKFRNSTIRRMIIAGMPKEQIAEQFLKWTYIKGKYSNGLQRRRQQEKRIFLGGSYKNV